MKTFQFSILSFLFILLFQTGFAQTKTSTFKVAGECGMCKKKIETAAKAAGASFAQWNADTKEMVVKYSSTANTATIQQGIANAGYDTPGFKATEAAYNQLHECCKYERTSAVTAACCSDASCCKDDKCTAGADCCKDGKCVSGEANTNRTKQNCCKKA